MPNHTPIASSNVAELRDTITQIDFISQDDLSDIEVLVRLAVSCLQCGVKTEDLENIFLLILRLLTEVQDDINACAERVDCHYKGEGGQL